MSADEHDTRRHDQLMKHTSVALSSRAAVLSKRPRCEGPQRCIAQNFIIKAFFPIEEPARMSAEPTRTLAAGHFISSAVGLDLTGCENRLNQGG